MTPEEGEVAAMPPQTLTNRFPSGGGGGWLGGTGGRGRGGGR